MNIVYLGTPDFAVKPLQALIDNGFNVIAVVTNKDKPVGRKQILTAPPVKSLALQKGIPVYQYDKIRIEGVQDLKKLNPDIMVTCAFGQILSEEILDIPKFGVLNIHASLLPKYRGASPIHYALLNGEKVTGITVMKTEIGIDTGDILLQKELHINDGETCGELFDRLSDLGSNCIIEALNMVKTGSAVYVSQDSENATITKIIKKQDALIDWSKTAEEVVNQIRAFNPAPVAFTIANGVPFKIYSAEVSSIDGNFKAGQVVCADKNTLTVGCGKGAVNLLKVQKSGGKPVLIKEFLLGNSFDNGFTFGK